MSNPNHALVSVECVRGRVHGRAPRADVAYGLTGAQGVGENALRLHDSRRWFDAVGSRLAFAVLARYAGDIAPGARS